MKMKRREFISKGAGMVMLGSLALINFTIEPEKSKKKYKIIHQRCNGCGHCYRACRDKALAEEGGKAVIDRALCTGCGECLRFCHRQAIVQDVE
jgi:ferredoxin